MEKQDCCSVICLVFTKDISNQLYNFNSKPILFLQLQQLTACILQNEYEGIILCKRFLAYDGTTYRMTWSFIHLGDILDLLFANKTIYNTPYT